MPITCQSFKTNKSKVHRVLTAATILFLFTFFASFFELPGNAAPAIFYETGGDGYHDQNEYLCRGNYGKTTCYSQNVKELHVASFYVDHVNAQSIRNFVEIGWHRWSTWSKPRGLWAIGIDIHPDHGFIPGYNYFNGALQQLEPGSTHRYQVAYIGPQPQNWQRYNFYIDDSLVAELNVRLIDGWATVACERNRLDENNYGYFWNLQRRLSNGSWVNWSNPVPWTTVRRWNLSNDPHYIFMRKSANSGEIRRP